MIALAGTVKRCRAVAAVDGVDLHIAAGETVALLGPNGAGKTTTIDLMLGLQRPDVGSATLFGKDPSAAVAAGRIGVMLQTGSLIENLQVRELVATMASLYPSPLDVDEVLELTRTASFADRRTEKLSGGETQRVRAAVALVANPDLLVLDEPTAALDVGSRRDFWDTMRGFAAQGKTILFATHHLEEADAFADRIVLMARGKVVADGPTGQIKGMVGSRTIRCTLPQVDVSDLPGVTACERHGATITLVCTDSDAALKALLAHHPEASDIEIRGAGLEEAFLQLTEAA